MPKAVLHSMPPHDVKSLTRRAALVAVAAVAAGAGSPTLAMVGEVDPIFAAIRSHKAALATQSAAILALSRLEEMHGNLIDGPQIDIGEYSGVTVDRTDTPDGRMILTTTPNGERFAVRAALPAEIDNYANKHIPETDRAAWVVDKKLELDAAFAGWRNARDAAGLPAAWEKLDEAEQVVLQGQADLLVPGPITMAGSIALACYVARSNPDDFVNMTVGVSSADFISAVLECLAVALVAIAKGAGAGQ